MLRNTLHILAPLRHGTKINSKAQRKPVGTIALMEKNKMGAWEFNGEVESNFKGACVRVLKKKKV